VGLPEKRKANRDSEQRERLTKKRSVIQNIRKNGREGTVKRDERSD